MWFGCAVSSLLAVSCSSLFRFGLTQGCVCVLFLFCLFFIVGFSTVNLWVFCGIMYFIYVF